MRSRRGCRGFADRTDSRTAADAVVAGPVPNTVSVLGELPHCDRRTAARFTNRRDSDLDHTPGHPSGLGGSAARPSAQHTLVPPEPPSVEVAREASARY